MRVLHVNAHPGPLGGVEAYLRDLLPGLQELGLETGLAAGPGGEALPGVAFFRVPRTLLPRPTALPWRRVLRRFRPDLLHFHNILELLQPGLLRRLAASLPAVYSVHDVRLVCPLGTKVRRGGDLCTTPMSPSACRPCRPGLRAWRLRLFRRSLQGVRLFLVPSAYLAARLAETGLPAERVRVHPPYPLVLPASPPPPAPESVVAAVARHPEPKGLDFLLAALAALRALPWRAEIVVAPPFQAAARRAAREAGLADRIRWHGLLDRAGMAALYGRARVVVLPSRVPEAFGLVGLEALAWGRPVVGFAGGGSDGWLRHGETGLLVPWGDPAGLVRALERVLRDPALGRALGERGRVVAARFQRAAHLEGLRRLYGEVLGVAP